MGKHIILAVCITLITSFLAGCNSPTEVLPTSTFTKSPAPTNTQMSLPTNTYTPLPTQTETPSPTNTHTLTPLKTPTPTSSKFITPTMTKIFPYLTTHFDYRFETPTPIALPTDDPLSYQLKKWSEIDALEIVRLLDQYAYASDLARPCDYRGDYVHAQKPLKLAIQETLLRFPKLTFRDAFEWRLALANAILSNPDSDDWILTTLEDGLNAGLFNPDEINAYIYPYGFEIVQSVSYPNPIGDEGMAKVFWLKTREVTRDGLFFLVYRNITGDYVILPIHSHWNFHTAYYNEGMVIRDSAPGSLPKIILKVDFCSCDCFYADLFIYQYQGNHFVDMTNGNLETDEIIFNWRYDDVRVTNVDLIIKKIFNEGELIDTIPMIESTLTELEEKWDFFTSDQAMLTYLLGFIYELSDCPEKAVQTYWQLWQQHPSSPYAILARAKLKLDK
jgi:hypothetical protein